MSIPVDQLLEAKREVLRLSRQGRMLTPHDAWMFAGHTEGRETLWSVALRLSQDQPFSAQELCAALERSFPQYSEEGVHPQGWHDYLDRPSPW